ncbi:hypothetical protein H696_05140 [Fonticula alba]|uniref:Kinesin motor domain-containing protein n=1 Tax=Fonticula alba TaxID=691883 RepID=A0A058Z1Q2_FONAL|nr:hypothetical protein H696_05140 [Fonticula alba]KCV68214.1 hypothetical protein H696_05140 [Fonticula alba]|eukprot:XP_009497268.1 hypothetical protein H696_05140 [Fonticula alba]
MSTGELPTQLTEQLKTFVRLRPVQLTQPPSVVPCSTNKHDLLIERAPAKAGASREPPQRFRYTHVFPEDTSQEDFFRETTLPLVRDMFTGTNTLFFAYGVSGGGKTFTLDGSASQPGVIPRALSAIFQTIGDYQTEVPVKPAHFDGIELFDAHDRAEKESAGILAAALASSSRSTIGATPSTPRRGLARNVSHLLPLAIPGSDLYSSELAESLCLGDTYSDDLQALAAVESTRFSVWVSACQIYNRVISDLLVEPATDGRLSSFGVPSTPGGGDRRRTGSTFPLATPSTPSTSSAATAAAAAASGSFPFGSSFGVTGMPGGTRVSTAPAPGAGGGAGGGGFGCPVGLGSGSSAPVVTDNGYIHGLVEVRVRSMREAFALIARAREHRARAATSQNVASSRSHSIYFIRVLQFPVAPGACSDTGSMAEVLVDPKAVRTSRLVLVDMAGAERSKKLNHSSAERQRESNRINETVLHLNACLEALRNKQSGGSSGFYSWSSDKLTKLFQPYFTGAGKAAMVLNVNPDPELVKETFHALQVGSVAQQLRTTRQRARPMVDIHDPTLARLPSSFQSYQAPFMDSGGSYLTALSGSQTPTVQAVKRSRATPTLEQAQNTYSARAMRYHMKHGREAATTPIRIVGGRTGQVAASAGGSPRLLLEHPWDLAHGTGNVGTGTPLRAGSSPGGALDITLAGPLATPRRWARPDPLRTPGSGPALPLMHGDDEEEDVVLLPDALIARDSERLLGSIAAEIASLKQRAEACRDCAARAIASAQSIDIENAVNEAKAELMGQALLQRDSLARSASEVETSGGADAPNSVALALMQDKAQLENALYEARLAADAADQRAYSTVHAYADRLRQAFVESDRLSSENRKLREELSRLRSILSNSGAAPGSPSRGSPAPADQPSGSTPDRGYHSPTGQAPLLEEEALGSGGNIIVIIVVADGAVIIVASVVVAVAVTVVAVVTPVAQGTGQANGHR